jgi:hypothetical protein
MDAPDCVKCGRSDAMVHEDSGLTYHAWRCTRCNVSRSKKNFFGKALPFLPLVLIFFGFPGGDGGDCAGSAAG